MHADLLEADDFETHVIHSISQRNYRYSSKLTILGEFFVAAGLHHLRNPQPEESNR